MKPIVTLSVACLTIAFLTITLGCGNDARSKKSDDADAAKSQGGKKPKPKPKREGLFNTAIEQIIGPLVVKIDGVELGPALVGDDKTGFNPSEEKYLMVRLTLTNAGQEQRLRYSGWSNAGASVGGHTSRLLDENDAEYAAKTDFGDGKYVQGQVHKATDILQGRPITEVLVFAPPPDGVRELKLELPGSVVLEDGQLRFAIPGVVIERH